MDSSEHINFTMLGFKVENDVYNTQVGVQNPLNKIRTS